MVFFLLIWVIATLGFIGLAVAMEKHQKQLLKVSLSLKQIRLFKSGGWLLLMLTLIISIIDYGIADGMSYWIGVLSFASLFVLGMVSYFSHLFKNIVIGLSIIGLIALGTQIF